MLCHRADPTNAMIGVDYSNTRSPWGVQDMLEPDLLPPSTPDFSGEVGLKLALCLVTSCYSHQTARWRPPCFWRG